MAFISHSILSSFPCSLNSNCLCPFALNALADTMIIMKNNDPNARKHSIHTHSHNEQILWRPLFVANMKNCGSVKHKIMQSAGTGCCFVSTIIQLFCLRACFFFYPWMRLCRHKKVYTMTLKSSAVTIAMVAAAILGCESRPVCTKSTPQPLRLLMLRLVCYFPHCSMFQENRARLN